MIKGKPILGFAAGLVLGLAVVVSSFSDRTIRRASAQAKDQASAPYQISSWAFPATSNHLGVVAQHQFGAYIIDTRSGKIWLVDGKADPQLLGQVP